MTIFPKDGLKALPHSKSVSISAPTFGAAFEGVVLELPGKPKTLYVDGKNAASVNLRERYVPHIYCLVLRHKWDGSWWSPAPQSPKVYSHVLPLCSIVALLDLASENLDCSALVIVLERSAPNLGELLHALMYVGGSVVTKPPFAVDPAFVLVGLEI